MSTLGGVRGGNREDSPYSIKADERSDVDAGTSPAMTRR